MARTFFLRHYNNFLQQIPPANFDRLPETVLNIVGMLTNVPSWCVHRQLDDGPIVSVAGSGITDKFAEAYTSVCHEIGIPLAELCDVREKAFVPSTCGTVLGTRFDSETLSWSWPQEKIDRVLDVIDVFLTKQSCTLEEAQKLHRKLSGFRFHVVKLLGAFENCKNVQKLVTHGLKHDLWVWKKCIAAAVNGFPIPEPIGVAPVVAIRFISDAAGSAMALKNGIWENVTVPNDRGVASVSFDEKGVNFAVV
jgi:hypothetical protein